MERSAKGTTRPATMKDIAEYVGVSKMAVSAVLSGTTTRVSVSEATRARIVEAARRFQYRPNNIARALSSRRTHTIGFYSGYHFLDTRNAFYAEMVGGLQEECGRQRKDLLLHTVFQRGSEEDIYAEIADGRIEGLIMTAPPEDPLVERLTASHLPVIVVADTIPSLPSVVVDDAMGAKLTFDYLLSRGHTRLAYRSSIRRLASGEQRKTAYFDAARTQGLEITDWNGPDTPSVAEDFLETWLATPPKQRPTAVSCWNDVAAYDLLDICWRRGVRVPEDLAVTGFDDIRNPAAFRWRLTTVRAPWAAVARTAVRLLVAQIEGKEVERETVLPVEFILGDSA